MRNTMTTEAPADLRLELKSKRISVDKYKAAIGSLMYRMLRRNATKVVLQTGDVAKLVITGEAPDSPVLCFIAEWREEPNIDPALRPHRRYVFTRV